VGFLKTSVVGKILTLALAGGEFVIILTHCGDDDVFNRAEALSKKIEALKPAGPAVTSSIAVATLGKDIGLEQCGFEQLFVAADDAIYKVEGAWA
jgi:two-component system cell cycle response regulator